MMAVARIRDAARARVADLTLARPLKLQELRRRKSKLQPKERVKAETREVETVGDVVEAAVITAEVVVVASRTAEVEPLLPRTTQPATTPSVTTRPRVLLRALQVRAEEEAAATGVATGEATKARARTSQRVLVAEAAKVVPEVETAVAVTHMLPLTASEHVRMQRESAGMWGMYLQKQDHHGRSNNR